MSHFYSFNINHFSSKLSDYSIEKMLESKDKFQATFKPLNLCCMLRKIKLTSTDLELIQNEIDIDKLINHPNIIKIIRIFTHSDGFFYTIFPYASHKSVDIMSKPYGVAEEMIGLVMNDILPAVDYLHKRSIIHSAIKASHILIFTNSGNNVRFVLTGLKYSQFFPKAALHNYDYPTNADRLLTCLAPEVLEQNILGYSFKIDIYALGIVCCELANGVAPFENMGSDEILFYKLIGDTPKPLDSTCEEMQILRQYYERLELSLKGRYQKYTLRRFTAAFHEFTTQCLHIDPTRRATVAELLSHEFMRNTRALVENDQRKSELMDTMTLP